MNATATQAEIALSGWRTVRRFFRTPKGLLLALFVPLACLGIVSTGHHALDQEDVITPAQL